MEHDIPDRLIQRNDVGHLQHAADYYRMNLRAFFELMPNIMRDVFINIIEGRDPDHM